MHFHSCEGFEVGVGTALALHLGHRLSVDWVKDFYDVAIFCQAYGMETLLG